MKKLTMGSLFAGIGGFDLGFQQAGYKILWQVEKDQFATKVLEKNFPNVKRYSDIKDLGGDELEKPTVITGGFPCQPFSIAGKRKGTDDDRDLWNEMFRIIQHLHPNWIIGENVANFVNMALERTWADLESENYEVQTFIIPAVGINAPHKRERTFVVAHANCKRGSRWSKNFRKILEGESTKNKTERSDSILLPKKPFTNNERPSWQEFEANWSKQHHRWNESWTTVATKLCRMDDGLPVRMDGFKLTKAQHRNARLKVLGNAVVPQLAYIFAQAIKEIEILIEKEE